MRKILVSLSLAASVLAGCAGAPASRTSWNVTAIAATSAMMRVKTAGRPLTVPDYTALTCFIYSDKIYRVKVW